MRAETGVWFTVAIYCRDELDALSVERLESMIYSYRTWYRDVLAACRHALGRKCCS